MVFKKSRLIGRVATITDTESIYYGEWGIVDAYDGEVYYIRIADGKDSAPIFERWQFKVQRQEVSRK